MRAGKRNKKVQLYHSVPVKGERGGTHQDWQPFGLPRWAGMKTVKGTPAEVTAQGGAYTAVTTQITMAWTPGVINGMQARHGATIYTIVVADNWQERNDTLILTCTAGANNA